ncbi:putative membrane protein [Pseudomonas chlororaphis]|nr:putative membrane protein [Pseudomonas chlororaphis]
MQHIIGMPLQLIIIGMPQSFIIFIIRAQQLFIMSMFMPAIGMILHIMQSASTVHSITHFIDGIGMPIIIGIGIMAPIIGMAMLARDMHIMLMLAQCIIIGMPQFIIICIICALFLNMAMSMPAAGIILHSMPSSIISQLMVAIIIGMPIIGMLAFIGICICMAFIMVKLPKRFDSWTKRMGRILGSGERRTRCRSNSNRGCRDSFSAAARAGFSA